MHHTHPRTLLRSRRRPLAVIAVTATAVALWSGVAGAAPRPSTVANGSPAVSCDSTVPAPSGDSTVVVSVPLTVSLIGSEVTLTATGTDVTAPTAVSDASCALPLPNVAIFGNRWTTPLLGGWGNRWSGSGW